MMKKSQLLMLAMSLYGVLLASAAADPVSGANALLCAASKVAVCSDASGCVEIAPEEADLPRFVTVDIARREITAAWPGEAGKLSRADVIREYADRMVLQGIDLDVPWSATIARETGSLVVTQSRLDVSFTIFGACMPK